MKKPFDRDSYRPSSWDEKQRQNAIRNIGRRQRYMIRRSQHDNMKNFNNWHPESQERLINDICKRACNDDNWELLDGPDIVFLWCSLAVLGVVMFVSWLIFG